MTAHPAWIFVDPGHAADTVRHAAAEKVSGAELILDFSAVRRLDSAAAFALEELAVRAEAASVRIVLRGIDTAIYKALKLLKLAHRFSFAE